MVNIISILLAIIMNLQCGWYIMPATVNEINSDTVAVEDNTGNLWSFYGDGYSEKESVILLMDDRGTETRFDDAIVFVTPLD